MLQKCYETLCNACMSMRLSNLATKSAIVKSGTKSDITESKEGEIMSSTSTASCAYTYVGELRAASELQAPFKELLSVKRQATSIRAK